MGYFGGWTQGALLHPNGAGAFQQYRDDSSKIQGSGGNALAGYWNGLTFDASRSSSIYSDTETVTPLSLSCKIVLKY